MHVLLVINAVWFCVLPFQDVEAFYFEGENKRDVHNNADQNYLTPIVVNL